MNNFATEVGVYERNASSVKEYAYFEDKNYRFRPAMEDSRCLIYKVVINNYKLFSSLYQRQARK